MKPLEPQAVGAAIGIVGKALILERGLKPNRSKTIPNGVIVEVGKALILERGLKLFSNVKE